MTIRYNNVVEWNRYLRDRGLEGETDRNLLAAAVPGFLQSGTFIADRNGEMWFKPYQGQGPSSVAPPPNAHHNHPSPEGSPRGLDGDQDTVMQDRSANDRRVHAGATTRVNGLSGEAGLRDKVHEGVTSVQTKLDVHAHKTTSGRNQLGRDLDEAKGNVSVTHGLGDQPDGRSAKQRLDKKPPEKTGGGSGEW